MSDALTLRPARASDAEAIGQLHADSWRRHYRGAFSEAYLDGDIEADRNEVWTARLAAPSSSDVTLVAEHRDELLGFVHAIGDDDPQWGSLIDNLHVRYDQQRRGVGRLLMAAAGPAVAERSRHSGLYLWVLQQNTRAQDFYRALGGTCVEQAPCPPPGGQPGRLHGHPFRLRFAWHDASDLRDI